MKTALLCLVVTCAQAQKLDPKLLGEDFDILRHALETGHSGVYRYTPKADLDRVFHQARTKIDRPMDVFEFYRLVAPAVAMIKCGHTSVQLPEAVYQEITKHTPLLPVDVVVLGNKLYVKDGEQAGAELRSINGIAAERILQTMLSVIHGDGNIPTAGPWRLSHRRRFALLLYALEGIEAPFRVSIRREGAESTAVLTGVPLPKLTMDQGRRGGSYRFLEDGKIAVLKVFGFGNAPGEKPLGALMQETFEKMQEKSSKVLILDLRDNGGGEDALGKKLLSFLLDKPFQYYDDLVINSREPDFLKYSKRTKPIPASQVEQRADGKFHQVTHPNWGIQQPGSPGFRGKVLVLMNGGSFSTTCEFLSNLDFRKRATFIGAEPAGAYYGNTSGYSADVTLPNSKLQLNVPMTTYYLAVKGNPRADRGVMPDFPVEYSILDVVAGTDKEMAVALKQAAE